MHAVSERTQLVSQLKDLNGSVQVTLVSSLYSEKFPDDENQLFLISRSKEGIEIISFFLCL